eukprot:TRINITY_DN2541_c0_g1_i1.p1 TRINITY_DN2541_c0_g1~~TRINITY_DN2541_c0_g1_i1.p1  ORF type:complete len:681 (-),score=176.74 TRINITY_DN2541_c0_g1_i1:62-2104(-)
MMELKETKTDGEEYVDEEEDGDLSLHEIPSYTFTKSEEEKSKAGLNSVNEEDLRNWKREFSILWLKAQMFPPQSPVGKSVSDPQYVKKRPPHLRDTRNLWRSQILEPSSLPKVVIRRRSRSMEWNHSWDSLGYYHENSRWRDKKFKKVPKRSVRFTEDTKDNNKVEMNYQVFEEHLLSDKEEVTRGLVYERDETTQALVVASATIEKLVSRLADAGLPDYDYIRAFLNSYRSVIGPLNLLNMLIERFDFPLPDNASKEDIDYREKFSRAVKLRVINVLRKWMQSHFYDFSDDPRVFARLLKFLQEKEVEMEKWSLQLRMIIQEKHHTPFDLEMTSPIEMIEVTMKRADCGLAMRQFIFKKNYYNSCFWGHEYVSWIRQELEASEAQAEDIAVKMLEANLLFLVEDEKVKTFDQGKIYRFSNRPFAQAPTPLAPKVLPDQPSRFLDIHPLELARQLTLLIFNTFRMINCKELSKLSVVKWSPLSDSPIEVMNRQTANIVTWIASETVMTPNISQRVEVMKRFIQIAEHSSSFQNYAVVDAVVKGLGHPGVARLQKTWKALGRKYSKKYTNLGKLIHLDNMNALMSKAVQNPPSIPVIDLYMTKIVHLFEQPTVTDNGMINFKSLRALGAVFEEIETQSSVVYSFVKIPYYQEFLDREVVLFDNPTIMKFSHHCEPNVRDLE